MGWQWEDAFLVGRIRPGRGVERATIREVNVATAAARLASASQTLSEQQQQQEQPQEAIEETTQ